MAERSKALRSGRSPLLWAWVRIPLLTRVLSFKIGLEKKGTIWDIVVFSDMSGFKMCIVLSHNQYQIVNGACRPFKKGHYDINWYFWLDFTNHFFHLSHK